MVSLVVSTHKKALNKGQNHREGVLLSKKRKKGLNVSGLYVCIGYVRF